VLPPLSINVLESVGVADSVQVLPSLSINVLESVGVADSVQVLPPLSINVLESVGVADSVQVLPSLSINVLESVGVADSVQVLPAASINVLESVGVADSVQVLPPLSINIAETVGVADSVTVAVQAPPTISWVSPSQGIQRQTLTVTITGTYFTGATAVSFGPGITVNSFTANTSTKITLKITIGANAALGTRNVSVTTPGGTATLTSGFTVVQAPPTISSVRPTKGAQGQTLTLTIAGTYFTGATAVSFGPGIAVNNFTVNSSIKITVNITIGARAALGPRNVSVTTPGGTATLTSGFTVVQAPPTISRVRPSQGTQGQTLTMTITGTYFTGATAVSFGPGITINSFTANTSTKITANITIGAKAALGPRNVSVTTPGGTATLKSGFTVK
jgi:NO-binding membrane sensor protein with MHYT domain